MGTLWQIYFCSAVGCFLVAITFFATLHPWQSQSSRVGLFDWKFWWKTVTIRDLPREGGVMRPEQRKLWFPGLLLGLIVGFVLIGIASLLLKPERTPGLIYGFWTIGCIIGPLLGNYIAYKAFVPRRRFLGWCYVILVNSLLGVEVVLKKSYISHLFERLPSDFLGPHPEKIIMVGVVLFCWRAATRGFENWKSDIREVRRKARMGPIPPDWSVHIVMNDFVSALAAIVMAILFV